MSDAKSIEITCPACRRDTLLIRRPKYEGFTKAGEAFSCASCGHEFADESAVPFKDKTVARVFTDADRSKDVKVFREGEADRQCRNCKNYVVNPFMQWCAHHKREVAATDSCKDFAKKPEPKKTV